MPLELQDAQPPFCAGRMQTEYLIHPSGASSLLYDLEELSSLIRTTPSPINMEEKKSSEGKAPGKTVQSLKLHPDGSRRVDLQ